MEKNLKEKIKQFHSSAFMWLTGQFTKFLMRPKPSLEQEIKLQKEFLKSSRTVGLVWVTNAKLSLKLIDSSHKHRIHVRRTDKKIEADYVDLKEYIDEAEKFFALDSNDKSAKTIYLMTDEPNVIAEAKSK